MNVKDLIPWSHTENKTPALSRDADPFMALHREVNRLFDDVFRDFDQFGMGRFPSLASSRSNWRWPNVEVSETDKEIRVTAELPGLEEKDFEVMDARPHPQVSQAFCSALPIAYSNIPTAAWCPFAQVILEAAYEATLSAAVLNAGRGCPPIVLLTRLGGGAFGNAGEWIDAALRRALRLFENYDLDVRLISRGQTPPAMTHSRTLIPVSQVTTISSASKHASDSRLTVTVNDGGRYDPPDLPLQKRSAVGDKTNHLEVW